MWLWVFVLDYVLFGKFFCRIKCMKKFILDKTWRNISTQNSKWKTKTRFVTATDIKTFSTNFKCQRKSSSTSLHKKFSFNQSKWKPQLDTNCWRNCGVFYENFQYFKEQMFRDTLKPIFCYLFKFIKKTRKCWELLHNTCGFLCCLIMPEYFVSF